MRIFILIFVFFACGSSKPESAKSQTVEQMPKLEQTKWSFKVVEGVYNYYKFTSKTDFKYYSAELEDMFYGNYEVKNDTLYTFVKVSASDSLLEADSPHRSLKTREKWIMQNGNLQLVHNEYKHLRGWIKTNPPSDIFYIKEE